MAKRTKIDVVIAIGAEVRDWSYTSALIKLLDSKAVKVTGKPNQWTFKVPGKKRTYHFRIVYTKEAFRKALDRKNAYVIYDGHSRYGQGPAFSDANLTHCPSKASYPVNPWEDTFKMGWDTIKVPCIDDIFDHCTNPKEYPYSKPPNNFFAKRSVKRILKIAKGRSSRCNQSGYAKRRLRACHPQTAQRVNGRGEKSLFDRHDWKKKGKEFYTLIQVGRKDLNSVSLKCKVLFMNSCESKGHFYYALKRRKRRKKSTCSFYMTQRVCSAATTEIFVKLLMKGYRPVGRKGSRRFLKAMGVKDSGIIEYLT